MELQISGTALGTTGTSDPPALGRDSIPPHGRCPLSYFCDQLLPCSMVPPKAHLTWVRDWSVDEWL